MEINGYTIPYNGSNNTGWYYYPDPTYVEVIKQLLKRIADLEDKLDKLQSK